MLTFDVTELHICYPAHPKQVTGIQTHIQTNFPQKLKAFFCQQMHSLLKHKMLQLTLKISLYVAPSCFGPFGPSSGSIRWNLAKFTVFVEIISKSTSLKSLLCCGNTCFSLYSSVCTGCCAACDYSHVKRYFKCKL
jgi:hypothetical protein